MSRSTIASLAILKVNFEKLGKDYLDNFLPLLLFAISRQSENVVSLPAIRDAIQNEFGLTLPSNALQQLLPRAARAGYLRRESGVYYRIPETLDMADFEAIRQKVSNEIQLVIDELQTFVGERYDLSWSEEEAEESILAFLGDSGLEVLYATVEDRILPVQESTSSSRYAVAAFVSEATNNNPQLFSSIETLIRGILLLNALYHPDPGRIEQRFKGTRVYLDTKLLLYVLGHAGPELQTPAIELVELLKLYGAEIRCFQQTIEEMRGIFDAAAARIRRHELRDAYGPVIEYFVGRGMNSTDIDLLSARVLQQLLWLGIRVEDKPEYDKPYVIDESGFEDLLMKEIRYQNPAACQHDVDCISAISRIRRGRESFQVEHCRTIFVTTNAELARLTRQFFQSESSPGAVALCITGYALSNLLWLKNPTRAPELPRRRLIADTFAAMDPPDDLWKEYIVEIARLEEKGDITTEDYYLLRYSIASRRALMDITKGSIQAFSEGTPLEILEIAKKSLRADLEQELVMERNKRVAAEVTIADRNAVLEGQLLQIQNTSRSVAKVVAAVPIFAISMLLVIGTLYTIPWDLPSFQSAWFNYGIAGAQLVLLGYILHSMWRGTTIGSLATTLHECLAKKLESRIVAWLYRKASERDGPSVRHQS